MFKIGDEVILFKTAGWQWNIPLYLIGKSGFLDNITSTFVENDTYMIDFGIEYGIWRIPKYNNPELEIICLAKINKWNPLNYKSHFEPLKLP